MVNRTTGHLVDGHLRVLLAMRRGVPSMPVVYVELTPEEEAIALATFDKASAMAGTDPEKLRDLLLGIEKQESATLNALLEEMRQDTARMMKVSEALQGDEDAVPPTPAEATTKPGDLIILGEHRLFCGSSADPAAYEAMGLTTEPADCVWTDPPYGVAVVGGSRALSPEARRAAGGKEIENDAMSIEEMVPFLKDTLGMALAHTRPGGVWYVAGPTGTKMKPFVDVLLEFEVLRQMIIWVKDSLVMGRDDYQHRTEAIFYGWKPGAWHMRVEDRTQTDAWEIARPRANKDHPTMKPVALVEKSLQNSTVVGNVVLDCFGGSGTTLLACHKTQRRARLIELDPRYCDVIVRRWEEATGLKAERPREPGQEG
jgi:site-specific DNA-methyltransferase (adenine-specific)